MKQSYKDWNRLVINESAIAYPNFGWFGGKRFSGEVCWDSASLEEYIKSHKRINEVNGEDFSEIYARQCYAANKEQKVDYLWINDQDVIDWFASRLDGRVLALSQGGEDHICYWFANEEDAKAFEAEFAGMLV